MYRTFVLLTNSDSEGHRFDSCRAYRRKSPGSVRLPGIFVHFFRKRCCLQHLFLSPWKNPPIRHIFLPVCTSYSDRTSPRWKEMNAWGLSFWGFFAQLLWWWPWRACGLTDEERWFFTGILGEGFVWIQRDFVSAFTAFSLHKNSYTKNPGNATFPGFLAEKPGFEPGLRLLTLLP